jgi:hypothetical protein
VNPADANWNSGGAQVTADALQRNVRHGEHAADANKIRLKISKVIVETFSPSTVVVK